MSKKKKRKKNKIKKEDEQQQQKKTHPKRNTIEIYLFASLYCLPFT
jgi:hypothetical protein